MTSPMSLDAYPEPRATVLVADDAHDGRQLLARLLQLSGKVRVVEARNGGQAVEAYQHHRPVMTFLDIDMPGMNGLGALTAIRAADENAWVVIVSGTASLANVQQAMGLGARAFVVKPFSAKRIIEVMRQAAQALGDARLIPE